MMYGYLLIMAGTHLGIMFTKTKNVNTMFISVYIEIVIW